MKKNLFFLAAAALMAAACSNEDGDKASMPAKINVSASLNTAAITRGTGIDLQSARLDAESHPGIYIYKTGSTAVASDGYIYKNTEVTAVNGTSGLLTTGTTFYFPQDKKGVDVYVYAPRQTEVADIGTTAIDFSVSEDQYNKAGYIASDFVFGHQTLAYSASNTNVEVRLYHALSKIIFQIKDANNSYELNDLKEVTLGTVKKDASINISKSISSNSDLATTGAVTLGTTDATISFFNSTSGDAVPAEAKVAAILPPQDIFGKTLTIKVGDATYTGTIPEAVASSGKAELAPGNQYTYTISLTQSSFTVTAVSIAEWTTTGNERNASVQ